MDKFHQLMEEVGQSLSIALKPDENNACRLHLKSEVEMQMEPDVEKDRLVIVALVGEVPAGKFREEVLKTSLKHNNSYPRIGNFAYSEKKHQLVCFATLPFSTLTAPQLIEEMTSLATQANSWLTGLKGGQIPQAGVAAGEKKPSIFDLKK